MVVAVVELIMRTTTRTIRMIRSSDSFKTSTSFD